MLTLSACYEQEQYSDILWCHERHQRAHLVVYAGDAMSALRSRKHAWKLGYCLTLFLGACATTPSGSASTHETANASDLNKETDRLNAWFAEKYEEQLQFSPMMLTSLGRKDHYGELDDLSLEAAHRQLAWRKATVEEMETQFNYDKLSPEAKTSYALWKYEYEEAAAGLPFELHTYVFHQMNGLHSALPTFLINFHRVDTDDDMVAYISRLKQVPRAFEQLLERAQQAADMGIRPPRFAYEGVIDQAKKVIHGAPFGKGAPASLWTDIQTKIDGLVSAGTIDSERAEALRLEAKTALVNELQPAYKALIAWMKADMPNAAVNPSGVKTLPNGEAFYAYCLRTMTTTPMTADEIHETGLREVERIHGEMLALKDRVGFEGDLDAFFEHLNHDPTFYFPDTDSGRQAYLDEATRVIANMRKTIPDYFGLLPKAELVVKRVEPFRERPGAAQHYVHGTPDGSRPGVYYVHLSDMNALPKTELEDVAYHEGIPGHHMQISIAQELEDVPKFRTQAFFTAYIEGWALYSEWLAKQMPGTFEDPYSEFGQLNGELWRAIRLVVDTGLHAKGWTEAQAVEYFDQNSSQPHAAIESEIQRYLVIPGQATSYKVGMMKIQALRAEAEAKLGDQFDIRGFHDTILGGGALPLSFLEERVHHWIASQATNAPSSASTP